MKKALCCWLILLACALVGFCPPSLARAQGDAAIWIEVYPAFVSFSPVHHTYLLAQKNAGKIDTCPCLGGDAGGKELAGSKKFVPASLLGRILFMCGQPPCAWPKVLYGAVGVCHQLANRGLYSVGATVEKANGYGMSHYFFGVYGRLTRFSDNYDMVDCLAAAPRQRVQSGQKPDEQIVLYDNFRQSIKGIPPMLLDTEGARLYKNHSWDSVRNRLDIALGREEAGRLAPAVEQFWSSNYNRQNALLRDFLGKMMESKRVDPVFKARMNQYLFETQDQFSKLLSPDQYKAFFNLPWPKNRSQFIDWSYFKDNKPPARGR